MRATSTTLLAIYSAILTIWLAALSFATFNHHDSNELNVERINVREPDGRLRLVISDRARFPGAIYHGKEIPFARDSAGMIFFNDEASENGGLIFSGQKDATGRVSTVGHLSFDQYDQDQVVNLQQAEDAGQRSAGLTISDRPDAPLDIAAGIHLRQNPQGLQRAIAAGAYGQPRAFFGKTEDHSAELVLRDKDGRARLELQVAADGVAQIRFLDASGAVTRTISADGQ
jgi:hypothetical protein